MAKSKSSRKPTGDKKPKKHGETTPSKKRTKKGAAQREEPTAAPPPPVEEHDDDDDDVDAEQLDGRHALDCLRHVLDACPKAKESPALAFVLLDGDRLVATDDYQHHTAWLQATVAASPVKITRASAEALTAVVAGELKAGEATESAVRLTWRGLIVEIERAGETHPITLEKYESGPSPENLRLAAVKMGAHVSLGADSHVMGSWRGPGDVDVFAAGDETQLWLQATVGGTTVARRVIAARGGSLGIRQPTLPGVSTRPTPPAPTPPAAPTPAPSSSADAPTGPRMLGTSTMRWVIIVVEGGVTHEEWREVSSQLRSMLAPYRVEGTDLVWGPYPDGSARVHLITTTLTRLMMAFDVRETAAPDDVRAFLARGDAAPGELEATPAPRQLGSGDAIDAEVIDEGDLDDGEAV